MQVSLHIRNIYVYVTHLKARMGVTAYLDPRVLTDACIRFPVHTCVINTPIAY